MKALPSLAVALILASSGLAACGDGDDDGNGAVETGSPRSGARDLNRFLMRKDEEPGFRRVGQPHTDTSVEAFVKGGGLTQADARRLRGEGFVSFVSQPIQGPRTAGVTNVQLFRTAEGAKQEMAHELRTDVIRALGPVTNLRRFTVPGVPGAGGWTGVPRNHDPVANAFWVQGRCVLVLGNQSPGPLVGPLSTGVRAIYERTNGQCP
jgi:hypothetical protein